MTGSITNFKSTTLFFVFISLIFGLGAQEVNESDARSIIQEYLEENQEKLNLVNSDIANWIITKKYFSKSTQVTHVYIRQSHNGVVVIDGTANFNIVENAVMSMGNRLIADVENKVNLSTPVLSPIQAIERAAEQLGLEIKGDLKIIEPISSQHFIFSKAGLSLENIPVKLVYQSTEDNKLKLSWDMSINTTDQQHWWSLRVDAASGQIISQYDWTSHCDFGSCGHDTHQKSAARTIDKNFENANEEESLPLMAGSYNVFAIPTESPSHGPRSIVVDPEDLIASPFGWHDDNGSPGDEYTITRGNNVHAYEDRDDNDVAGDSPDGTSALDFNFPYDVESPAFDNLDAATTNLFYMNNIMHDVWYQYGFDEPSGNFQEENYTGTGGFENDYVRAEAQDGSGTNNANFSTPEDGSRPRMQMYLWAPNSNNFFTVNAPPSSVELDIEYENSLADFGPPIPTTPLTADLVLVSDESGDDPYDACESIENGSEIDGKIAVIRRGTCEFGFKVLAAEDEGAVAVIIINNVAGGAVAMGAGAVGNSVTIPSIMLSMEQGQALLDALEDGDLVNGTIVDGSEELIAADSDFDNGIIAHEYGHGISIRLTGGANNSNCLFNAEQMGEGWSDWFGIMLTTLPGDQPEDPRGVGTYVINQPNDGNGIRPAPYSTDFAVNDFTYDDTNFEGLTSQPHGIGFVWSTMLWDLNWALIDIYGYDPDMYNGTGGNNMAMQLVIDGLKLQPCSPGFVDGRDAILEADMLNYDGAHQCLIWTVFANRGLGASASQGSSDSRTDQTEAFDIPAVFGSEQEYLICEGESIEINGETYDSPGTFVDTFPGSGGCDSTVTSIIDFATNADVTISTNTLTADNDNDGVTYQWINCDDGSNIVGATDQTFNPTDNGEYAVIITEDGCANTSECIEVVLVGIEDFILENIVVSPNPTSDYVTISFGDLKDIKTLRLTDATGKVVYVENNMSNNSYNLDMTKMSSGIYFMHIQNELGSAVMKILKE